MALRRVGAAGKGKQKELTEEQKQEIKEAFDLFDTDGSVRSSSTYAAAARHVEHLLTGGDVPQIGFIRDNMV